MATPVWNQLAAPNYSAANGLIAQAMSQLTKAGEGLQGVAKEYKDTIQNRNLGLIQEYINSAKTPEELQSEGFQTGLAKLTENMRGEYDTSAKAQLVNKATDTLLSRKANQVSIDTNQFNLDTGRKNQLTKEFTNKILAAPPEQRDALRQAAIDANAFDPSAYQQYVQGEGAILNQNNVRKLFDATYDANVKNANLAPVVTEHGMEIADRNAATAEMNARTNKLQAEAAAARAEAEKKNTTNSYIGTGLAAIDAAKKGVKEKVYGSGLNTDPEKSWKKWEEKTTAGLLNFDPAPNKVVELIDEHPELRELPDNLKILHAENALRYLRKSEVGSNPAWWFTSNSEETVLKQGLEESFKNFNQQARTVEDNATIPIYRKTVLEHAQKTGASGYAAAKDLGLDELTIYKADIPSQLAAQAKLKYASSDKSVPESQFIEHEIRIATDPNYGTSGAPLFPKPKQEAANVPAQSSRTVLNTLGTGSYEDKVAMLGSELKKTKDPMQIAFLNNELRKLEKDAPPVTANTSNSLQEQQQRMEAAALARLTAAALKQNGQPPVTPALTAKPVADPLRQAALEQPPVATNNISQPRQLPTAEIAQKGRKEQPFTFTDTPLKVLTDAAKLKEATLPVVPAIAVKPEEVKPRELTPAEKQQAERMNQEALVRLTGAKLIEKQAEVQKQFPTTPLKELANAVKPVPSPLVPVESQNAFKSRDNNLSINLSTGKSVPSKDPVPMPKVSWGKPAEVVTMNPMVAKLPQYKAVATFMQDGDTFTATSKQYATKGIKANGNVLCRVDSVDAPETPHPPYKKGQPYGEEARKKLQQMILNKEISIRIVRASNGDPNEPGLYGRDICQIEVEGANVSTELIRAGAAWLYREYNNYFTGLETVEANAKAEGRGLFSNPNAVYPQTAKHSGSLNLR